MVIINCMDKQLFHSILSVTLIKKENNECKCINGSKLCIKGSIIA
jgi:hypothetical protein